MSHRTVNPAQRLTSKRSTDATGAALRRRSLTNLRTIDETAEIFNTSTRCGIRCNADSDSTARGTAIR